LKFKKPQLFHNIRKIWVKIIYGFEMKYKDILRVNYLAETIEFSCNLLT